MTAPSGPEGPRSLHRFLLDGEHVVVALHQHWAEAAEPVGSCVAGLIFAFWADTTFGERAPAFSNLVWIGWAVLLFRMGYRLFERRHDWFVATDKRLLLFYGLLTQKVAMMPLAKVTDMSYVRSPLGRLLVYGEFVLESAGQDQALRRIKWVPDPDETYRLICAEIFGVPADEPNRPDPGPPPAAAMPDAQGSRRDDDTWPPAGGYHGPVPGSGHAPTGEQPRRRGDDGTDPDWSTAIPVRPAGQEQVYPSPDPREPAELGEDTGPIPLLRPRPEH